MGARYPTNRRNRSAPNFVPPVLPLSPRTAAPPMAPIVPRPDPIPTHEEWWRRQPVPGHGRSWQWASLRGVARGALQGWWLTGVGYGFQAAVEHYASLFPSGSEEAYREYWTRCWTRNPAWPIECYNIHNQCAGTAYYDDPANGWALTTPVPNGWTHVALGAYRFEGFGYVFRAGAVEQRLPGAPTPTPLPQIVETPVRYRPGFFEVPSAPPMLDPMSQPLGVPLPMPAAIPVRVLPDMVPNPTRHPSEQPQVHPRPLPKERPFRPVPGVTVHPAPEVGAGPSVVIEPAPDAQTDTAPGLTNRPPTGGSGWWGPGFHARRPPRKKEHEKKPDKTRSGIPAFFMGGLNAVTEAGDMIDAAHRALPDFAKAPPWSPMQTKLGHVLDYVEDASDAERDDWVDNFMDEWRNNEVKDFGFGMAGRASAKATRNNPAWASPTGPQAGPWDRPPRPNDRKPRDRWGRFGGYNPR